MRLAREGYPFAAAGFLFALAVQIFGGTLWAFPFWLFFLFVLQFFRDPARAIPNSSAVVVSPADGKVVAVERMVAPGSDLEVTRIAIFLNVFSVHANRIPIAGTIVERSYIAGKFLNAAVDKSSSENERNMIVIRAHDGKQVTCIQIAGLIARRILCYVDINDPVSLGQRYGFIRFGSRVELYLPLTYKVRVNIGDKIKGGSDVVASCS